MVPNNAINANLGEPSIDEPACIRKFINCIFTLACRLFRTRQS